jgi:hypothetical protein
MNRPMKILLGTTKGLLEFGYRNGGIELERLDFRGLPVSMIHHDGNTGMMWIGLSMKHWGPKLFRSSDAGRNWQEVAAPLYPEGSMIGPGKPATLRLIWSALYHGRQGKLWVGTEPGGLFESLDGGDTFNLNEPLWDHPTRAEHWFGGGRNHAGIHTILDHPDDPDFLLIGVSCGGVYVSRDDGLTWSPKNQGLRADYLPDPHSPYGHDPHAIRLCRQHPDTIWQQNHCGVFISHDAAESWQDVTPEDQYGRYGFPIVIDDRDPLKAWIIPAESDDQRVAKDLRLVVCKTEDGGKTWIKQTAGLPQVHCFDLVFRHAFDRKNALMVFGTTTGNLFISADDGDTWNHAQTFLPPIHSVLII